MCAPMRYTANKASVKRTRFRRSSMRKRFESAWRNRFMRYLVPLHSLLQDRKTNSKATAGKSTGLKTRHYNSVTALLHTPSGPLRKAAPTTSRQNLKRAACLGNLFLGGGAKSVSVNGQLCFQFAVAENFYLLRGADKAVCAEQIRRNGFASRK